MQSTPEIKPVCGACAHFEPARNEPAGNPKYGYCKPRERLEQEEHGRPAGKMIDVTTPCFMVTWDGKANRPAFEPKGRAR